MYCIWASAENTYTQSEHVQAYILYVYIFSFTSAIEEVVSFYIVRGKCMHGRKVKRRNDTKKEKNWSIKVYGNKSKELRNRRSAL